MTHSNAITTELPPAIQKPSKREQSGGALVEAVLGLGLILVPLMVLSFDLLRFLKSSNAVVRAVREVMPLIESADGRLDGSQTSPTFFSIMVNGSPYTIYLPQVGKAYYDTAELDPVYRALIDKYTSALQGSEIGSISTPDKRSLAAEICAAKLGWWGAPNPNQGRSCSRLMSEELFKSVLQSLDPKIASSAKVSVSFRETPGNGRCMFLDPDVYPASEQSCAVVRVKAEVQGYILRMNVNREFWTFNTGGAY
jgi:hypothetical protein